MAASLLSIANQAIARLGARTPISSLEESSTEAGYARTFLEPTLRATLASLDWRFASATVTLALTGMAPPPWQLQYAMPELCLVPRAVVVPGQVNPPLLGASGALGNLGGPVVPFAAGLGVDADGAMLPVIWCDLPYAALRFTAYVDQPGFWEPGFTTALTWALAAELAMPLTGKPDVQQAMLQGRLVALNQAAAQSAQGQVRAVGGEPDWLAVRSGLGTDLGAYPAPAAPSAPAPDFLVLDESVLAP